MVVDSHVDYRLLKLGKVLLGRLSADWGKDVDGLGKVVLKIKKTRNEKKLVT